MIEVTSTKILIYNYLYFQIVNSYIYSDFHISVLIILLIYNYIGILLFITQNWKEYKFCKANNEIFWYTLKTWNLFGN